MIQIRALALDGSQQADSAWSASVPFTLPLLNLAKPSGLRYDRATMEVIWNPVNGANGYTVNVFQCDTGANETRQTGTRYLLNDERQNVYQVAQVRAIFEHGHLGPWSPPLIFCFIPIPPPATPTGLQVTAGMNSFTWQVDPVEGATSYVVGYRASGSTAASDSTDVYTEIAFDTHTGTVDGLAASTQYAVRVRAKNESGESENTADIAVTTIAPTATQRPTERPGERPTQRPNPDPDPDPPPRATARPTSRPQPQPDPEPTEPPVTCSPRGSSWVQSWTERTGPSNCQHERRCSVELQQYECTDGRRYNKRLGSPSCGNWYFVGQPSCPR